MQRHGSMLNNMPELPEVETVKNILIPLIVGKIIEKVDVIYDRLITSDLNTFKNELKNKKIEKITRHGKYLFFHLSSSLVLIVHLRMEGKFRYISNSSYRNKHATAIFYFSDGTGLSFDDTRKFAVMHLSNETEYKKLPMIAKLGLEPFDVNTSNINSIIEKFNRKKTVKELLLDQTILCGIGNIYADETLYLSRIHPLTLGKDLSQNDIKLLVDNSRITLQKAVGLGGTTIHSFHPSEGVDGKFQEKLLCYGKKGEICPLCESTFHKFFVGGRGTTFCPNCQIDHNLEKAIGLTGPIGSGKSAALEVFKANNYLVISSDEEVHELYRLPEVRSKLRKIVGFDFNYDDEESKEKLKAKLITSPQTKVNLENYIYPLVEERLIKYIRENPLVCIEVPLLFKAHFEYLFKKIIVIKIDKKKQVENLVARGTNKDIALKLNNDYSYKDIKKVITVENSNDLLTFKSKIQNIINKLD